MNDIGLSTDGRLAAGETTLIDNLPKTIRLETDPLGAGVFLVIASKRAAARHEVQLGNLPGLARFTCCYRNNPFWMVPATGTRIADVPPETQFLMAELTDGRSLILLPLIDGWFRAALQGSANDRLTLIAQTGDGDTVGKRIAALLVGVGDDPYQLMHSLAASALTRMKSGRRRADKPLPPLADLFCWCTWDAFYQQVSHDKVLAGLESFARIGVSPRAIILDDGWHTVREHEKGGKRLAAFNANERFPDGLGATVRAAKELHGIDQFYVWHTMTGYWNGVDGTAMPDYKVVDVTRHYDATVRDLWTDMPAEWWDQESGLVHPDRIGHFFNDFHRHLREQGVDGVKVDNQAELEALGEGLGGRVELMRTYREALEGSVHTHFLGSLINCMSCSNEMVFSTLNSNLTRSSTDFWPKRPESHSLHVYTNAQTSFWMGEFVHPDWDMFQSGHEMGAYHAAARAVGGCPVYVSDHPDQHNAEVLRKLVLSDGTVLRARLPGRPTRDCLYVDPRVDSVPLKIFNCNPNGGVIGAFNCRYVADAAEQPAVAGTVSPSDVYGLTGDRFAIYAHQADTLVTRGRDETLPFTLDGQGWEVFTIVPIWNGLAPIGLADKLNSGGAVRARRTHGNVHVVDLRDGGRFVAWCESRPATILVEGVEHPFAYDEASHRLSLDLAPTGQVVLEILRVVPQ